MASEQDSEIVYASNKNIALCIYVDTKSAYANFNYFRSPVEGAIKLSRACFGCFECVSLLAWLNNCDCLGKNYQYIFMHLESAYYDFRNYRHFVEGTMRLTNVHSIKVM
jgi:hypothetical protein